MEKLELPDKYKCKCPTCVNYHWNQVIDYIEALEGRISDLEENASKISILS